MWDIDKMQMGNHTFVDKIITERGSTVDEEADTEDNFILIWLSRNLYWKYVVKWLEQE